VPGQRATKKERNYFSLADYPDTNSPTLSPTFQLRLAEGSVQGVGEEVEGLSGFVSMPLKLLRLLRGCRIDQRPNSRDSVGREAALLGMLTYRVFIGGHVNAVDFVVRDVTVNPLNLSIHRS
jgi:hypothetical protein